MADLDSNSALSDSKAQTLHFFVAVVCTFPGLSREQAPKRVVRGKNWLTGSCPRQENHAMPYCRQKGRDWWLHFTICFVPMEAGDGTGEASNTSPYTPRYLWSEERVQRSDKSQAWGQTGPGRHTACLLHTFSFWASSLKICLIQVTGCVELIM